VPIHSSAVLTGLWKNLCGDITLSINGNQDRQMSTENQVYSLINEAQDNRHLVSSFHHAKFDVKTCQVT
ncbi:hypothetical protein VP01_12333g1, partial [Puccinia sorghi]